MITHQYEEYKPIRPIWSWLAIILLAILTGTWGMMTHMAIPEAARQWDFDVLPDTPGISPYSTLPPPEVAPVPPQIDLPEGRIRIRQPSTSASSDLQFRMSNLPPSRDG